MWGVAWWLHIAAIPLPIKDRPARAYPRGWRKKMKAKGKCPTCGQIEVDVKVGEKISCQTCKWETDSPWQLRELRFGGPVFWLHATRQHHSNPFTGPEVMNSMCLDNDETHMPSGREYYFLAGPFASHKEAVKYWEENTFPHIKK